MGDQVDGKIGGASSTHDDQVDGKVASASSAHNDQVDGKVGGATSTHDDRIHLLELDHVNVENMCRKGHGKVATFVVSFSLRVNLLECRNGGLVSMLNCGAGAGGGLVFNIVALSSEFHCSNPK